MRLSIGRYILRSMLAHKGRLVLTAIAIVVGVGTVAGTFVLADTTRAEARAQFTRGTPRADIVVRAMPREAGASGAFFDDVGELIVFEPLPATAVDRVTGASGVRAANGVVTGDAHLIGRNGRVVTGRPTIARSVDGSFAEILAAGRLPAAAGEIVLDAETSREQNFKIDQRVRIIVSGSEPQSATVVGILDAAELPAAVVLGFQPAAAQSLFASSGLVGYIEVHTDADAQRLAADIATALGPDYQVVTGTQLAVERASRGELDPVFAGILFGAGIIALLVGILVIRNTYTIVLAGRTRELALLRCVGAGRWQLRSAILVESSILGALAGLAGVVFGVLAAWGMASLLDTMFGVAGNIAGSLPRIEFRTVAVALAVGVVTAMVSAWGPARRATRVPPVAALRGDVFALDRRAGRFRAVSGSLATGAGVIAVLLGALASPAQDSLVQIGAGLTVVGLLLFGPVYAPALAGLIAAPIRRARGVVGALAGTNATRSPKRTAATILPLVIGLAMIGFLFTVSSGSQVARERIIDEALLADHKISAIGFNGRQADLSPELTRRLEGLPELATVAPIHVARVTVAGEHDWAAAVDPARLAQTIDLSRNVGSGTLVGFGPGDVAISREAANRDHLNVGSVVSLRVENTDVRLTVRAILDQGDESAGEGRVVFTRLRFFTYVVTPADFQRLGGDPGAMEIYTRTRDGVSPAAARAAIERALADAPQVEILDRQGVYDNATFGFQTALRFLYSLLGLAVVVALVGIVNTLALGVLERTRELGMLRAIGMDRAQLRAMIRWEGLVIAGIGTAVGLGLGTFLGWGVNAAATDDLLADTVLPLAQLALFALAGLVAGVSAALLPAHRASRVNALRAIAVE